MAKTGRPPRRIAAIHALDAWADLVARFPGIAALKTVMTTGNASRAEIDKALESACNEMIGQPDGAATVPSREVGPEAEPDTIATALQTAIRDRLTLRRLGIAIMAAADEADQLVAALKDRLWAAIVTRPVVPGHVAATADALLGAGLITPVSRGISASQLARIAAILNENGPGPGSAPAASPRRPAPPVAWRANNAWTGLPREIPGYRLTTRPVSAQDDGLKALIDAGLPPFSALAAFDLPLKLAALKAATTNSARAAECWKLLEKWLRENRVAGSFDDGISIRRRRSWVFLFSLTEGFNQGVADFDKVQFASPWAANQVVVAERVKRD